MKSHPVSYHITIVQQFFFSQRETVNPYTSTVGDPGWHWQHPDPTVMKYWNCPPRKENVRLKPDPDKIIFALIIFYKCMKRLFELIRF